MSQVTSPLSSPSTPARIYGWAGARFAGAPAALFALDALLADVLRTTSQPIVGQMRLTWWHEALTRLETSVPAHPALQDLARDVTAAGVPAATLASIVEGWEALLDPPLGAEAAARHAGRGAALFAALARADGHEPDARTRLAGEGWALMDLAAHATDPAFALLARAQAATVLEAALASRWHGPRAIGALAIDARMAAAGQGTADGPRRAARILRFALTSR